MKAQFPDCVFDQSLSKKLSFLLFFYFTNEGDTQVKEDQQMNLSE